MYARAAHSHRARWWVADYKLRCAEARAQYGTVVEENLRLAEDHCRLLTDMEKTKAALATAEQIVQAAAARTQVLEGTVARLKAAAAEEYERVVAELRQKLEAGKREVQEIREEAQGGGGGGVGARGDR